jgi:guanylate kinase
MGGYQSICIGGLVTLLNEKRAPIDVVKIVPNIPAFCNIAGHTEGRVKTYLTTYVDGVDYYFVSDEQYNKYIEEDAFYEFVDSQYGNRYGTLRSEVDSFLNVGEDVVFDIDWEGARQMRQRAPKDVVTIYLLPPSIKEVRERLENRGTDSKEVIEKRMNLVVDKIVHWDEFDYVVVNAELEDTVEKIRRIISGERMKRVRQQDGLQKFVNELIEEAKAKK